MAEKILDWKGNEVKAGMVIYFVQTRVGFPANSRHGVIIPGSGEMVWEKEEDWIKRRDEEIWELGQPYNVDFKYGQLWYTTFPDEEDYTYSAQLALRKDSMIAIKGISDKNENHDTSEGT